MAQRSAGFWLALFLAALALPLVLRHVAAGESPVPTTPAVAAPEASPVSATPDAALRRELALHQKRINEIKQQLGGGRWGSYFWWEVLSWAAQIAFFSRFLVQWLASERAGRSVMPVSFWYLSIVGGLGLTIYSAYVFASFRTNLALVVGQAVGLVVYSRNLALIQRTSRAPGADHGAGGVNPGD